MRSSKVKKGLLASGALLIAGLGYLVPFLFGLLPPYGGDFIYVAVVGRMSGPDIDGAPDMVKGINLALDRFNKQGGANGKKIKLLAFDDQNDEALATAAALEITKDDRIMVVLGHNFSSTSIKGGEVYGRVGLPAISASATAEAVTRDNDWYFRTAVSGAGPAADTGKGAVDPNKKVAATS